MSRDVRCFMCLETSGSPMLCCAVVVNVYALCAGIVCAADDCSSVKYR